jgi:hypothetical protein
LNFYIPHIEIHHLGRNPLFGKLTKKLEVGFDIEDLLPAERSAEIVASPQRNTPDRTSAEVYVPVVH